MLAKSTPRAVCRLTTLRSASIRTYASGANPSTVNAASFQIFDRNTKRLHRDRAASNPEESRKVDYLRDEIARRLVERLLFINRSFPKVLDLGAGANHLAKAILSHTESPDEAAVASNTTPLASRITNFTAVELSPKLLHRDPPSAFAHDTFFLTRTVLDEEDALLKNPEQGGLFDDGSFDAVISSGSMHWINDLPSVLRSINRVLKPDGPFIAAIFGGDTLFELRTSLQLADTERLGGVGPHVSPLADVRDVGGLLQKAGFKLLTVDVDDIVVEYPDVFALMKDLQSMGEANAVLGREKSLGGLKREVLEGVDGIYRELHGGDEDGKNKWKGGIPATFRVIFMIGWKEAPTQQKPLPRGSGEISMKDVLGGGGTIQS